MSKSLIITEKPSVAGDIAKALGGFKKGKDYFENEKYLISWAVGHVVELQMPEDIDKKKYGFWRLETLPVIPGKFELKPIEKVKDRYNALKKLIAHKDIGQLINACDAGREGELIFTNLCRLAKNKHPVKRLWLQSMTLQAIREGFQNLRDGSEMADLADAARSRSESDWLIGINGTRAMTAFKSGDPLTLNRLYGRSSGHKLRKSQQDLVDNLLPQIEVPEEGEVTAVSLFGEDRPLHFEIGFGAGEHLAFRADLLPDLHDFVADIEESFPSGHYP